MWHMNVKCFLIGSCVPNSILLLITSEICLWHFSGCYGSFQLIPLDSVAENWLIGYQTVLDQLCLVLNDKRRWLYTGNGLLRKWLWLYKGTLLKEFRLIMKSISQDRQSGQVGLKQDGSWIQVRDINAWAKVTLVMNCSWILNLDHKIYWENNFCAHAAHFFLKELTSSKVTWEYLERHWNYITSKLPNL
jgi:hypothetical protein